jgi:hypothetical protein
MCWYCVHPLLAATAKQATTQPPLLGNSFLCMQHYRSDRQTIYALSSEETAGSIVFCALRVEDIIIIVIITVTIV